MNLSNQRFKVFEKLIKNGYDTDKKIINMKVEQLILLPSFNRMELTIAVGIRDALIGKCLVSFLCGTLDNEIKKNDYRNGGTNV